MTPPLCKYCRTELYDHFERVVECCAECYASGDKQIEADADSAWESFQNEKYETREANSRG